MAMTVFTHKGQNGAFKEPSAWLSSLAPDVAGDLISAATDIAFVVDSHGVIGDIASSIDALRGPVVTAWIGRRFADIVTVESRPKAAELLRQASAGEPAVFRELNHPIAGGRDVPVRYSAHRARAGGPVIVLGRDLRPVSVLQQRLLEAQQAMEREYARLRGAETRYRMLFQLSGEPVVVVDAASLRIVEANGAAQRQLALDPARLAGTSILSPFAPDSAEALQLALRTARVSGHAQESGIRREGTDETFDVSASSLRQDGAAFILVRLAATARGGAEQGTEPSPRQVLDVIAHLPDAFVVIDENMTILEANRAFLDLAQLAARQQAIGEPLDRWLGRPDIDLRLALQTLSEHGVVRNFPTIVRGNFGGVEEVEMSAVPAKAGTGTIYGFVMRARAIVPANDDQQRAVLPRSADQLAELVGRVSLKELVREATSVIERLCIETALDLSRNNRASAAQMLGLSRQSFYAKLRRYGLGDLGDDEAMDGEDDPDSLPDA